MGTAGEGRGGGGAPTALALAPQGRELARSGWTGGASLLVPALLVSVPIPFYWQELYWWPVRMLRAGVGYDAALALVSTLVWAAPALGGLLAAVLLRRLLGRAVGEDGERLRALGAGACMAGTLVAATVIVGKNLVVFEAAWVGLQVMAAALGLGVLGTVYFRSLPGRGQEPGEVPALYRGMTAAGAAGPAMMAAMIPWTLVAAAIPALGPRSLALLAGATDPVTRLVGATALSLVALAPVTWFTGKALRRLDPRAPSGALCVGLVLPALVALLFASLTPLELGRAALAPSLLALAAWWTLGLGAQVLAATAAARSRRAGEDETLPGSDASVLAALTGATEGPRGGGCASPCGEVEEDC